MRGLLRKPSTYLRWYHHRQVSTAAATTPAAVITETLTKKVGGLEGIMLVQSKQTFKEKWNIFWRNLYVDYKDVAVETWNGSKAKPKKATFYLSLTGGIFYLWFTNPTEYSYLGELTKTDTEVSFVSPAIRNPYAENYAHTLLKQKIKGELRYQNFELFSVIWRHDADKKIGLFQATCKYLKPLWSEVGERFVDIGFAGKWWMLERNMVDFDVNPLEWEEEARQIARAKEEKEKMLNS